MKLLLSWARDFVDIAASARDIADTMALRGFEVASVEPLDDGDAVIDFEVTANRPDCLSVIGLAREIAVAYDLPLTRRPGPSPSSVPPLVPLETGESTDLRVSVDTSELCPRYSAAVAEVTPCTTPQWMASRLQASGVRPISPFVDITNYVLIELGQPMHAFDLETLAGREICVRSARAGESLVTLDGVTRTLDPDMLVIADGERPQAVAGVMGGGPSEVSARTRLVAFESACFKPASVRRTSKRLGLKTEASARFERGTDINATLTALRRAVALMQQIGAGQLRGAAVDVYWRPRNPGRILLRRERLRRLLGIPVPDDDVVRILTALSLEPTSASEGWDVLVPTFRVDVQHEVDLIEEVGRHYGFDQLRDAFPPVTQAASAPDPRIARDRLARHVLAAAGLNEAVTFGFIGREAAGNFVAGSDVSTIVPVANPLSAKFDVLRPSLLPGLLEAVAHNRRHGRRDVGLYELGARFTATDGERRALAFAWTGDVEAHWSGGARSVDFFDAKGVVELFCSAVGVVPAFSPVVERFLVPGRAAAVLVDGNRVGIVGEITPSLVESAGAPRHDTIVAAELDLDAIERHRSAALASVVPLPRYPFVVRDLSIVVADALPADTIRGTIQAAGDRQAAPLVAITFFDRYQGKGVPEGSISISIRLTFQAPDRTLTDPEVQTTFDTILAALVREHGAVQR